MTLKHKDQVTELLNRRRSGLAHMFKILYIVGELFIINISLIAALFIIYDRVNTNTFDKSLLDYFRTAPFLSLAAFLYIDYLGMTHFFRKNRVDVVSAGIQLVFLTTITGAAIAYFGTWFSFSRYSMALGGILMLVLTCLWSLLCLEFSKHIYSKGKLLIVAVSKDDADRIYMKVCGQLKTLHINYLGYTIMDSVPRVLRLIDKSTEVLVSSAVSENDKSQLFLYCADRDKTVYIVPQFSDLVYTKFRVVQFEDMPTFMIDSLGLTFQQRILKRMFDVIFSLLAIILTLPVQLVIALLVKIDSSGPALYSQDRITRLGRIYKVYKFRTMENEAEEKYGAFQSSLDDPRVTHIGKFLRNTHIDELPQFFNILKGDMSVVGPRSDRPTTIGEFEDNIPGYNQRLKVKAGLTGLAQISGKYNTSPEDKLSFDMMYIKNYSFLIDMKIVLQTIWAMVPSKKNYNIMDGDFENWEFVPKK